MDPTTSCKVTRNDNSYPFDVNINCSNNSFTINDEYNINISTTYVFFEENIFVLASNDSSIADQKSVDDFFILRRNKHLTNVNPMIYSSFNIIGSELPCCLLFYTFIIYL